MNLSQPKALIFPQVYRTHGARNWPFLMFTAQPRFWQHASSKSVWRAQEGGNLEQIHVFGGYLRFLCGVNVRDDGEIEFFPYFRQDAAAFLHARSAEGGDGGAVGLVVGCLENQRHVHLFSDGLDGAGHFPDKGFAFQGAGAQKVERPGAADFNGLNIKRHKTETCMSPYHDCSGPLRSSRYPASGGRFGLRGPSRPEYFLRECVIP